MCEIGALDVATTTLAIKEAVNWTAVVTQLTARLLPIATFIEQLFNTNCL